MTNQIPEGRVLKAERVIRGVRQFSLAAKLGVAPTVVCDVENGRRRPTEDFITSYRRALDELATSTTEMSQGGRAA